MEYWFRYPPGGDVCVILTWRAGHGANISSSLPPSTILTPACAPNVELTAFYPFVKQQCYSINVAIVYVLARASNAIPEFRQRIRAGKVVEHEIVHPSTTIPTGEDLFTFCPFDYIEDFTEFAAKATERIAFVQEHPNLADEPGKDDVLYMTAIPWVSFTAFMHPMLVERADSVPRFAWGKFFEEGERLKMPLSVQAHHGLVDGIHIGRFYEKVQECFQQPEVVLGVETAS